MAFYMIAGIVIAFATHMVGDLYVFGFLIIPPVAAMLLVRKVTHIFLVAVLIGLLSPPLGLYLAFAYDLPSSPAIVGVASVVLGVAWVVNLLRRR